MGNCRKCVPRGDSLRLAVALSCVLIAAAVAQSHDPKLEPLVKQGQRALDAGDFQSAVSTFEQAAQLAPDNLAVNRGLVLSYLQSGLLADAMDRGKKAVTRWPNDPQVQHWLGLAYFKAKMNDPALEALRRSEKLDSSQFGIHFDIALVLLSQEQYPPAGDELEKAVRLN